MARYSGDPYWMTARRDSASANKDGTPIRRGDRIFYYPRSRQAFVGREAEAASADFEACAADEDFANGGGSVAYEGGSYE